MTQSRLSEGDMSIDLLLKVLRRCEREREYNRLYPVAAKYQRLADKIHRKIVEMFEKAVDEAKHYKQLHKEALSGYCQVMGYPIPTLQHPEGEL